MNYVQALQNIPSPGAGCHTALLGVANLGILAGLTPERIFADIRAAIPTGRRRVPDREIPDAIDKAAAECEPLGKRRKLSREERRAYAKQKWEANRRRQAEQQRAEKVAEHVGKIPEADPVELWERSPIRLTDDPSEDAELLLRSLYGPDELVWCGGVYQQHPPQTPAQWIEDWHRGEGVPPHVVPNPLSGEQAQASNGNPSYRCDAAVSAWRFVLIEFDDLSIEAQAGRICWMLDQGWAIACVIHSGGKSLHAWFRVNLASADAWQQEVHNELFPRYLIPMGADRACRNASRLSRLPGAMRDGQQQRLLYLAGASSAPANLSK